MVVGDSKCILKYFIFDLLPQDFRLASIIERIKHVKVLFAKLHQYDTLHENNPVTYYQENSVTRGEMRVLIIKGKHYEKLIP
jgi:hypothetical protein